jgi:hypothetical protein
MLSFQLILEKLLGSFPDGAQTTCKSGDVVFTAADAGKVLKSDDSHLNQHKKWGM